MGGGGKRWFDLFYVVITLICLAVLAFVFFAGSTVASASLVSWTESDHDPADFSPVTSDGSGSLPGIESREAESLVEPGAIDQEQEEEAAAVESREAESLAEPGAIDQQQEEEAAAEESREAVSLSFREEIADDDQEDDVEPISITSADLSDIALDVSAIRGYLETSSVEYLETQETEQVQEENDVDPADGPGDVSSDASSVSSDTSSPDEEQEEPATLDTIHQDLTVLIYTLWGFAGILMAFKVGGAVLGRL